MKERAEFIWPDAFIQSPLEKSQTMAQTARAVTNISRQTGNQQPMQLITEEEAREILGFKGPLPEEGRIAPIEPQIPGNPEDLEDPDE